MNITPGLLFSAPGLGKYISGAILYEETLFQSHSNGTPFVDLLKANGLFPGIKVDTGLQPLPGADPIETWYVQYSLIILSLVIILSPVVMFCFAMIILPYTVITVIFDTVVMNILIIIPTLTACQRIIAKMIYTVATNKLQ